MTPQGNRLTPILVADDNRNFRRLVSDVLRDAGFGKIVQASDGPNLLRLTAEIQPRIAITASRLPGMSGLEFTRLIRSGYESVNPALSIIVMTSTPTVAFLDAARTSGADEMLVCPFAPAALLARVEAVLVRPRRFIKSATYVGPCRRRRMLQDYGGKLRRGSDAIKVADSLPWEAEANRELVRESVKALSECAADFSPDDDIKLTAFGAAIEQTGELAEEIEDQPLEGAAKSLGRYVAGMRASETIDPEVVRAHVNAMNLLASLTSEQQSQRQALVEGLVAAVDKRLSA